VTTRTFARLVVGMLGLVWALSVGAAQDLAEIELTHPAIQYTKPSDDPIANLVRRTGAAAVLASSGPSGYLRSILQTLDVPVSSQILVFSNGSVQGRRINAGNPRALYFNDSVVVGWVRRGFIEIAAQDPAQGSVFYIAEPTALGRLSIARSDDCLSCHYPHRTGGVPGLIEPMGHARPLERRWGGWYVTGTLGSIRHPGNVDIRTLASAPETVHAAQVNSLEKLFDTTGYLTPYSDIAALMVFEHQMQMMNLLTRVGWETRVAQHEARLDAKRTAIRDRVNELVDYMLFVDEAPIASKLEGTSGFAAEFSGRGPRDPKGRSLRQLDLTTRLLRYPCSYMIYSAQFERLPSEARAAIYERLWSILSGSAKDERYRRLSSADRRAIVEILRATKPDLPAYFSA
jgi:hypothetical protein